MSMLIIILKRAYCVYKMYKKVFTYLRRSKFEPGIANTIMTI